MHRKDAQRTPWATRCRGLGPMACRVFEHFVDRKLLGGAAQLISHSALQRSGSKRHTRLRKQLCGPRVRADSPPAVCSDELATVLLAAELRDEDRDQAGPDMLVWG